MKEAQFYKKIADNRVKCGLCGHNCIINDSGLGICAVRKNHSGMLYTLNYGYPAALNADPVEKKPLFHFKPGSLVYSLGTLGCNFFCDNCQNFEISQSESSEESLKHLDFVSPEKIIETALGEDCSSIAYTYNEPTVFSEYCLEIMKLAHEHGLKNIWVTNGYMSRDCLRNIVPYLDAINVDLKSMDGNFYINSCGAKLEPVLRNLKIIKAEHVHLEITTLLIPSLSDDINMLAGLAEFIAVELDVYTPWHISRFSPEISWKLKGLEATAEDVIYEAYEIGKEAGLKYVYVGNVPGDQKENTYCPGCGELAIRRLGYHIERLDLKGHCVGCDKNLDIIE